MTTQLFFFLPNREDQWPIHVKGNHRSASRGRLANYQSSLPTRMFRPPFSSRTVSVTSSLVCGSIAVWRAALRNEHDTQANARFSAVVCPPAARGTIWSM